MQAELHHIYSGMKIERERMQRTQDISIGILQKERKNIHANHLLYILQNLVSLQNDMKFHCYGNTRHYSTANMIHITITKEFLIIQ